MFKKLYLITLTSLTFNLFCAEVPCIVVTKKQRDGDTITKKTTRHCTSYIVTHKNGTYEYHKEGCKNLCSNRIFCKYRCIFNGTEKDDDLMRKQAEYLQEFRSLEREFDKLEEESIDDTNEE